MKEEKEALRRYVRKQKMAHASLLPDLSAQIIARLEADEDFVQAATVLLYSSLPDEVDTRDLLMRWYKRKLLLLPVVQGDELRLKRFCGEFQPGPFGIQEPSGELFGDYGRVDLAVVPGMAFDAAGRRLGRGKGYYDRLLPCIGNARSIGLCFPFQYVDKVPAEAHDVRMDKIITLS